MRRTVSTAVAVLLLLSACAAPPGLEPPVDDATAAWRVSAVAAPIASPTEELWIIARSAAPAASQARLPELRRVSDAAPLPPHRTTVHADISGYVASVRVQQRFVNRFAEPVDTEYVFALPAQAAVSDFVLTVGGRSIRAAVRDRAEAERFFAEAKRQGRPVSLLSAPADNTFRLTLANLPPSAEVDVDITTFHTLSYRDGQYAFVFPTQAGAGGGPAVDATIDIAAGADIESISSPSHELSIRQASPATAHIELAGPGKGGADLVLYYKTTGTDLRSALVAHHDQRGGFFALMLQAPADEPPGREPMLGDVQIDWGGLDASHVHPAQIADLRPGAPTVLIGRFAGRGPATIRVSGLAGGRQRHSYEVQVSEQTLTQRHPALVLLWARAEIAALERQAAEHEPGWAAEHIKDVALEYGIVSPYTAMLAVDASRAP